MKNNLVIIPFNIPWDWSTDYANQTALILSEKNIVVCFLWPDALSIREYFRKKKIPKIIKKRKKNLYIFSPLLIVPFRRLDFSLSLNLLLNTLFLKFIGSLLKIKYKLDKKVVWAFHPNFYRFIRLLGNTYISVYDCVDFWTVGSEKEKKEIEETEKRLLKDADIVTAISKVMQKHLKRKRAKVFLVPQGFRLKQYANFKPNDIKKKKRHLIGYIGAVNYRINYQLLFQLAKRNQKWDFIISGPILDKEKLSKTQSEMMQKLFNLGNAKYELKDKDKVPEIINEFDIATIPYVSSDLFNVNCYPMKIFEYFYLGKPVISTTIKELKRFPRFVKIGESVTEWEKHIKNLLANPWPDKYKKEQRKLAKRNSWKNKVKKITKLIEDLPTI